MSNTPETFGRYQLLKLLARGGMGEVHLARQAGLQGFEKLVVVKRILPHLADDDEFVHMFLDEAHIAANLSHPNIVQVFDLGKEGQYFYIAMEYVHGDDVRRIWKRSVQAERPVPPAIACRIIADAAAGLDYAHRKTDKDGVPLGIVHRDISPHNIIVTFEGGVKVIDFGIARARNRMTHTATGALKGRFEYMSPEHASGQDLDGRADQFALGVVLWETLAGVRLFKRDTETATLLAVTNCVVPPASERNPAVPPELDAILTRAIARNRDDRYPDTASFRLALEEWIAQSRQSGTSAHLADYMRELYADRLAQEKNTGMPVIEEATGSRSRAGAVPAPVDPFAAVPDEAPTKAGTPAPMAGGASQPTRSPSKTPLIAGVVIASVTIGALIGLLVLKSAPPPGPPKAVAPATISLHVDSEPQGAEVLLNGVSRGHTPLDNTLPRSERPARVRLQLEGYQPHEAMLALTNDTSIKRVLTKLATAEPPPEPVVEVHKPPPQPPKPVVKPAAPKPPAQPQTPPALDIKINR